MEVNNHKFQVLTLNVRGLRQPRKRKKIYKWIENKNGKESVVFLQEAHCTYSDMKIWEKEWSGISMFSFGTKLSRGVITLFGKNLDIEIIDKVIDDNGRYIIQYCSIQGSLFLFVNTYFPNTETEQVEFLNSVNQILSTLNVDHTTEIIWGGDFNCCLTNSDKLGGAYSPKKRTVNLLKSTLEQLDLCDIWRLRNMNKKEFTWRTNKCSILRRLDYIFVSNSLQGYVNFSKILAAVSSDHSAVCIKLDFTKKIKQGPSHWCFNSSLVNDKEFVQTLNSNIKEWKTVENQDTDPRVLWEYIKYKCREFTIKYSKNKAQIRRSEIDELEKQVHKLENETYQDVGTKNKLMKSRALLKEHYNHIVEGSILRSKSEWYEEGEKCSKFFLNLEKRNKKKKHYSKVINRPDRMF